MRIARIDLTKYGKFTDQSLALPRRTCDFHVIVGPNEAGKSTLRNAILDLLFGIETRSAYNFLHPHPEMLLGGVLEEGGQKLEFRRSKKKQSLSDLNGHILQDAELIPYLGTTGRGFFDQMFGLDREKLVAGGKEILDASKDVSQVLFQSAAGISDLGKIRDAFESEADELWAKTNRSSKRAYFLAADELASAEAQLKAVTIRTKEWVEAQSNVKQIEDKLRLAREALHDLERKRSILERVRRVGPAIRLFREKQGSIANLTDVVKFAADTEAILNKAESELAIAGTERTLYQSQATAAADQLSAVTPDVQILKFQADVIATFDRWQQVRNHEHNIAKAEAEALVQLQQLKSLSKELGWILDDEKIIESRLPSTPKQAAIASQIKSFPALKLAAVAATAAVNSRASELLEIGEQIKALPVAKITPTLKAALSIARSLGDINSQKDRLQLSVEKTSRELKQARTSLGGWDFEIADLQRIVPPTDNEIERLVTRLAGHESNRNAQAESLKDVKEAIGKQELRIKQYRTLHQPVTREELLEVRGTRDALWASIKTGSTTVQGAASQFESNVNAADDVSDKRHDKAQEVGELQAQLDNVERLKQDVSGIESRIALAKDEELAVLAEWSATAEKNGLKDLPLAKISHWKNSRDTVLNAAENLLDAESALKALTEAADAARSDLYAALLADGYAQDLTIGLPVLVEAAGQAVDLAIATMTRKEELLKRQAVLVASQVSLNERVESTAAALSEWQIAWKANMASAGLEPMSDIAVAETALGLFLKIHDSLAALHDLQQSRIGGMNNELSDFRRETNDVAALVAPDLLTQPVGSVSTELVSRLTKAKADQQEADRLHKNVAQFNEKIVAADLRIELARKSIKPLLQQADVATNDDLRQAISRSDLQRVLSGEIENARKAALDDGDGLALPALETELDATDASQIQAVLADLEMQRIDNSKAQNQLSADLANANAALLKIAGQSEAAKAEGQRQDALAKMANAAERYIKVYTAGRLLRWSIDQYRDSQQGPMLKRASEIFSVLTMNSFQKLIVDFEKTPVALEGQRADGRVVEITGMSDGTRDQLYLALRLAALELHLEKAQSLPFIADDLFINFDDTRAKAGLKSLATLAEKTQVIFLTHHDHLLPMISEVMGADVGVTRLSD